MTTNQKIEDTAELEALIVTLEPAIIRGQFKAAACRLEELIEKKLADEGGQGARALLEKMHLIAGDRRTKAINVTVERRATS